MIATSTVVDGMEVKMKCDWDHPLPFGDSRWIEKSDAELLVNAVRVLLDHIYEFGKPIDSDCEQVETAIHILTRDKNKTYGEVIHIVDPLKPWTPGE